MIVIFGVRDIQRGYDLGKELHKMTKKDYRPTLEKHAKIGLMELRKATPVETGKAADSWSYGIENTTSGVKVTWYNSDMADHIPIVLLLKYGHASRDGSFVEGVDFISPPMIPVFRNMIQEIWKEVKE